MFFSNVLYVRFLPMTSPGLTKDVCIFCMSCKTLLCIIRLANAVVLGFNRLALKGYQRLTLTK